MKKSIRILFAALAATTLALAVSCSKEENGQTEPATASKVSVNITGLSDNNSISEVIISNVNNGLSISMDSDGIVTIEPLKIGSSTVTRRGDAGFSRVTTDGRAAFTVAMVENAAKDGRKVTVKSLNEVVYFSAFTASALKSGASYNTVYALNRRDYVIIGGKKWARMNIGATTIASSAATAYGDYYGWGMTRKLYKSLSFSADNDNYIDFEDAFKENGFSRSSYIDAEKWEEAKDFMPYDETSKIL